MGISQIFATLPKLFSINYAHID